MKKYLLFLITIITSLQFAQTNIITKSAPSLNLEKTLQRKIVSHKLYSDVQNSLLNYKNATTENRIIEEEKVGVVIYFEDYPTDQEIRELENLDISCYLDSWTPPLANHPYGFILAKLPPSKLQNALAKSYIKKMDSSTQQHYPNNNISTVRMYANSVWMEGYDGAGVKVAILDSGLDSFYEGTDLPLGYARMDYSNYPTIDQNVENTVSGHGTHVTGSVLGRGVLSDGNIGNGSGTYKGAAPGADLVFLKIGNDANGSASTAAIIGAMENAVTTFNADILSMSYGGWYDHHDGSSATEQKVDWAYSQGVPFFIAAGNEGESGRHYSGSVLAGSTTGFIKVNVSNTFIFPNKLTFNLVWADGIGTNNNLDIQFYNSSMNPISTLSNGGPFESARGTESEYFYYNSIWTPIGTYYIKVINSSGNDQEFHIYEALNNQKVTFQNPDPFYTIGQPASADHACAVGAYTTRSGWTDYSGTGWITGNTQGDISPFSSRGPRVDGLNKPEILAPGSAIISLRDTDVLTTDDNVTIDNDGNLGVGAKNYYVMQGTSMACPLAAGAAALYLQYYPGATPQEVYDALQNFATVDTYTGTVPNSTFGYGKLNIYNAIFNLQLAIDITILMEGAYDLSVNEMTTTLNTPGGIPLSQPFNINPWYYPGLENVSSIPTDVTDWVLIELRSGETTVESIKPAFVKKDGSVINLNGSPFKITGSSGTYYIVVYHRNHLSVMSKNKVTLSNIVPPPISTASVEMKFKENIETLHLGERVLVK